MVDPQPVVISFLSDFGLDDGFVGACHGVITGIAPEARIVDITHGIEPQAVLQGALVLADTLPYVPAGIHLAVVDPGVGSDRRGVAVRDREGRIFVGPDNGLLVLAAERAGIEGAWALENAAYRLERVSRTFHGRDVFAPAAAYVATGVMPEELGPPLEPASLVRLDLPAAEIRDGEIHATVLLVDRYGNAQLNLSAAEVEQAGFAPGARLGLGSRHATLVGTFAEAPAGELLLYEDSYGRMALAIGGGNAAEALSIRAGDELAITGN